jgi:MFS family permease
MNRIRIHRRIHRPFFGWWIVIGSALLHALHSSSFGFTFGIYLLQLQNGFGWSKFAISSAFSVSQLVNGFIGPAQGWLVDRFGSRMIMCCGTILFGLAFMGFSTINRLETLFLFVILIGIGASLSGFLAMNATLTNWFFKRRALAMGLGATGLGLGGALAPLVALLIVTHGWRATSFASGLVIILIGLPLVQLFRRRPEDYGLVPDGTPLVSSQVSDAPLELSYQSFDADFTVGEAVRDRNFWLVSIGHGLALVTVFTFMVHLVPHLVQGLDWSETAAQSMFTVATATSILGQVIGGVLGDRYSKTKVAGVCMLGHCSALILLSFAGSPPLVVLAALVHGFSWGARGPLMMAIRADFYGRRNFATIAGISTVIVMGGPLLGPSVAGALSDAFGDYKIAFFSLGILTGVGSIFFFLARVPQLPRRLRQQSAQSQ